jgi:hypothetical protein
MYQPSVFKTQTLLAHHQSEVLRNTNLTPWVQSMFQATSYVIVNLQQ